MKQPIIKRYDIFYIFVIILAIIVRLYWLPLQSGDFTIFLEPWYLEIKENGGLAALAVPIGDYNILYLFLLAILTYFPWPPIFAIKLLSCLFDFILAWFAKKIVLLMTGNKTISLVFYILVLFWPETVLNSSAWAQCDAMYTTALVACIYFLLKDNGGLASCAFGIAFSFKLQAVFFAPVLLILLLKRKIKFRNILIVPFIYTVSVLPAVLAGRSIFDVLTIYLRQTGSYNSTLSSNAPSLLRLIPDGLPQSTNDFIAKLAIIICGAFVIITIYLYYKKVQDISSKDIIFLATFYMFSIPWLLPYMHERYFFPAAITMLVYVSIAPFVWCPLLLEGASMLYMYGMYLFGWAWDKLWITKLFSVLFGCILIYLLREFCKIWHVPVNNRNTKIKGFSKF